LLQSKEFLNLVNFFSKTNKQLINSFEDLSCIFGVKIEFEE